MISSIREVLAISQVTDLESAFTGFDLEMTETLKPLTEALDHNVLSRDVTSIQTHMAEVESWRDRVVRYQALVTGFVEHAKSAAFLPAKAKGSTELDRDAFRRKVSAGFVAWQKRLEGLIDCIDSRVNLSKKVLFTEVEGFRSARRDT